MTDDIIDTAGCSILKRSAQNDLNLQQLYFLFPLYNPVHNINNTLPTGASFIAMINWFAKDINYRYELMLKMLVWTYETFIVDHFMRKCQEIAKLAMSINF